MVISNAYYFVKKKNVLLQLLRKFIGTCHFRVM